MSVGGSGANGHGTFLGRLSEEFDAIFLGVGPHSSEIPDLQMNDSGQIAIDPLTFQTSNEKVFAGGDVLRVSTMYPERELKHSAILSICSLRRIRDRCARAGPPPLVVRAQPPAPTHSRACDEPPPHGPPPRPARALNFPPPPPAPRGRGRPPRPPPKQSLSKQSPPRPTRSSSPWPRTPMSSRSSTSPTWPRNCSPRPTARPAGAAEPHAQKHRRRPGPVWSGPPSSYAVC